MCNARLTFEIAMQCSSKLLSQKYHFDRGSCDNQFGLAAHSDVLNDVGEMFVACAGMQVGYIVNFICLV